MKINFKIILQIFFLFFTITETYAGDIVNNKYREQFLSEGAKKAYYKIQANVTKFFDRQTSSLNGLVESFRGTSIYSYDIFTNVFAYGKKGTLDAQAFTYDGAIAALAYLVCDQPQKAANILKVYQTEFYCVKNERYGLFNSYRMDKESTKWGLPIGIDGDRMHVGPTVWVAIAAIQYTAVTGKPDFLPFIIDICKWTEHVEHYRLKSGHRGAVSMGYGWGPNWAKVYSTENVVDHYALLKMIKELYELKNDDIREIFYKKKYFLQNINREIFAIERWLMEVVYDGSKKKTFNMGANEDGVDTTDALDTVSWSIPAITPQRLFEMGVNPYHLMQFADKEYLVEDVLMPDGVKIKGYDFTNYAGRKKDYKMVWFEGTGFHIVAMQVMSKFSRQHRDIKKAEYFRQKAMYFLNEMTKASVVCTLIDGSLPYTSKRPKEKEILTTFHWEWEIPRGKKGQWVPSVSSTGWYIIALSAFDPLSFDKENVDYKLFKK
ncbi:MAG: hypothetical protein LBD46_08840 [Endomicrobium sp.]|jgi:hypothetical protein|nr:hypothetical protein [Endomicrobium sp.]